MEDDCSVQTHSTNPTTTTQRNFIPARNEEANIGALLQSLQQQNYPQHLLK
ncbi:MAG: hypothetical protein IPM85_17195 [Chitinophagaceae bacterium]|nr:hypothetical protein [Chitinophagaceae bacterium]